VLPIPDYFTGIKAMVINMGIPTYLNSNVFIAFQNSVEYPRDNVFVVITQLDVTSMSLIPSNQYDSTGEIENIVQLDSTMFQVDFYGVGADTGANKLRLLLQSANGSNFLNTTYNCNVHEVGELLNLTGVLDRENYTKRYAVRFSLFGNNSLTIGSLGFSSDSPILRLAEIQT
jgi:hypothetical protein